MSSVVSLMYSILLYDPVTALLLRRRFDNNIKNKDTKVRGLTNAIWPMTHVASSGLIL